MDKTSCKVKELDEMFKRDSVMSETAKLKKIQKDVDRKHKPIHPKYIFGKMPKGTDKSRGKYRKPDADTPT